MSRQPRDPRDPFNDPFFNGNDKNGPFGFDPFNDPFFKQFEQIHQHIFRDFFGGDDSPSIYIQGPNSSQSTNNNNKTPDLSQINPDAPPSNNKNNQHVERNSAPSFFRLFDHFFQPEYDDHKLSDINPNLSDNGPIMNNDNDNKGLVHPDGAPPGFRSPYLPNWNGVEKEMTFENNDNNGTPKRFFRSQSITITTGPDGKTRKTTTIRDSNGQETTNTEEYDAKDNGFGSGSIIISPFDWGQRNRNNDNNNDNDDRFGLWPPQKNKAPPLFEQTHDPFARFREKWQNWRWNPYNWGNNNLENDKQDNFDDGYNDRGRNQWFWRHKNDRTTIRNDPKIHGNNNNDRGYNKKEGFKWR